MDEVSRLLKDKGINFKVSGNDYVTTCFSPNHEDSTPSFRIDKVKGIGNCFSCGFKFNIFKYYGLITNTVNIRISGIKEKLNVLKQSTNGLDMLDGYTPMSDRYRGISVKTLNKFDMFYTDKVPAMEDRIIVPLKDIKGKIKVFVGRHILSNGNPRYMVYPAKATMPLFPSMLDKKSNYIVLVEGLFDMLNLYDKGLVNVVAAMGTQGLNSDSAKHKLLPFKAQGVTHIFICFDGDKAGREAAVEVQHRLEGYGFIVELIPMEDDSDPGGMDQEDVDGLRVYATEKSTCVNPFNKV